MEGKQEEITSKYPEDDTLLTQKKVKMQSQYELIKHDN